MLDVNRVGINGTWWRQGMAGLGPLAWREPAPDARWQRGSITGALYLADSPETAWAEFFRAMAELGLPPRVRMPRDLQRVKVRAREIADLTSPDSLAACGLEAPRPTSRQWPAFQGVGEQLFMEGARGLKAPSAAREGGIVLCLFRQGPGPAGVKVTSIERFEEPPPIPDREG